MPVLCLTNQESEATACSMHSWHYDRGICNKAEVRRCNYAGCCFHEHLPTDKLAQNINRINLRTSPCSFKSLHFILTLCLSNLISYLHIDQRTTLSKSSFKILSVKTKNLYLLVIFKVLLFLEVRHNRWKSCSGQIQSDRY